MEEKKTLHHFYGNTISLIEAMFSVMKVMGS